MHECYAVHIGKDKISRLIDLVNSTSDRVIIFYNFNTELEALRKVLFDRPISIVNGQIKDLKAYENNDNSVTLIQYQAGAMGLNLQKANRIIYFSLPNVRNCLNSPKQGYAVSVKKNNAIIT